MKKLFYGRQHAYDTCPSPTVSFPRNWKCSTKDVNEAEYRYILTQNSSDVIWKELHNNVYCMFTLNWLRTHAFNIGSELCWQFANITEYCPLEWCRKIVEQSILKYHIYEFILGYHNNDIDNNDNDNNNNNNDNNNNNTMLWFYSRSLCIYR